MACCKINVFTNLQFSVLLLKNSHEKPVISFEQKCSKMFVFWVLFYRELKRHFWSKGMFPFCLGHSKILANSLLYLQGVQYACCLKVALKT